MSQEGKFQILALDRLLTLYQKQLKYYIINLSQSKETIYGVLDSLGHLCHRTTDSQKQNHGVPNLRNTLSFPKRCLCWREDSDV